MGVPGRDRGHGWISTWGPRFHIQARFSFPFLSMPFASLTFLFRRNKHYARKQSSRALTLHYFRRTLGGRNRFRRGQRKLGLLTEQREAESFNFDVSFESTDLKNLNSPPLEVRELEELPEQWRRTKLAWLCKELPKHKAATLIQRKWIRQEDATYLAVHCMRIRENETGFRRVNLVEEIGEACKNWGFFQVINHGVPLETREKFESAARKFFAQSTEEKRKVKRDEVNPQGYYDTELTKNVRDWKEVFDLTVKNPTVIPASYEPGDKEVRELVNWWPEYPPEFR
ncbi:hypothetical protein HYC85_009365 [Camellia sinensis]|uniref:Non-haem dioxygenase N-terminal domain-containing protein n=1 Tax=Camellia sinensis TaxID=4442 RepID=A0A7J7HGP9_CAMSI|nr:hypothetical protein HYC85_009365 [Camellia sinensis]